MNLCRFEKPSRYINHELNSIHKEAAIKVALAFPDIYDVGMSHLGLRILYKIINDLPYASAERVFSPWLDMEAEMKARGIPLASLETKRPLKNFDIVGFSLQYELSYTTVLNMLSMAGIPIRSEDRDEKDPLVIAGGPCTVNPLPMSAFVDAFLVGDGEDAVKEILEVFYSWKRWGEKRESLLLRLSEIGGLYVPSIGNKVKRRYIRCLDDASYPVAPVVPYTQIVHDRINIEVSRGCSMGCRFCQAGMIYRPQRERSPERILKIAEESLKNTGYEDISLTSLSAGDYSSLPYLTREINRRFPGKTVSISLPSLRVGAVNQDVLREIRTVRKTGFTMAPEAATERLRMVINKDFSDEDYERALHALFSEGWENLKLYFMIGLPTEGDEDIEAIPEMALRAIGIAKRYTRRYVNLNIGISPFVPKPHTPLQWHGQEEMGKIKAKLNYLRHRLRKRGMTYKGHNPEMSLLEAVFSRGDERLSGLIEKAWSMGCRLDAWTDAFDFRKWLRAAEATGVDIYGYARRCFDKDDMLPWDFIDTGIRKEFLWREFERALSGEITPDCKKACYGCGLGCKGSNEFIGQASRLTALRKNNSRSGVSPDLPAGSLPATRHPLLNEVTRQIRVRVQFSKTGDMRYLSHRELITAIIRAIRRADVPVLYSQGFHPSPRVSFGPPLNVGISGLREYFDIELAPVDALPTRVMDLRNKLNQQLPEGLRIEGAQLIPDNEPSLDSFISRYEYEIICPDAKVIEDFLDKSVFFIERERANGRTAMIDIRGMVEEASIVNGTTARLVVIDRDDKKARLGELLPAIFQLPAEDLLVTRTNLFGWRDGWIDPCECKKQDARCRMGKVEDTYHASGIVNQEVK
ncbi:MAG: TIGR03960 family B12-binding radical SAM protein [Thermodesulfovibrionales bacterium]